MQMVAWIVSILLVVSVVSATGTHAVSVGQPCGGDVVCDRGLWCEPPTGECTSREGVCIAIPRLCFARKSGRSFKPVCGCNSKTYSSDCFRRARKIGKSHDGKCGSASAAGHGGQ